MTLAKPASNMVRTATPSALCGWVLCCVHGLSVAFPEYDSPRTAAPAPRPASGHAVSCTVPLITNASLDSYDLVVTEAWVGVPDTCASGGGGHGAGWDLVTLRFQGSVAGVQFDRFGALWFAGVELLRTTTPEPATGIRAGTHWDIEHDVTDYARLFTAKVRSCPLPSYLAPGLAGSSGTHTL